MALKVFRTRIGFYDAIVATNSRPRALRLWGVKQDLFKQGVADETREAGLVQAAIKEPHTPLYRAVGSNDAFLEQPKISGSQLRAVLNKKP